MGKGRIDGVVVSRLITYAVRLIIIATMVISAALGAIEALNGVHGGSMLTDAFTCLVILIATFIPSYINNKTKIIVPAFLQTGINLFTFASMYLGNIFKFYSRFVWWDIMLHTTSGFMLGLIGFLLFYSFNRDKDFVFRLHHICITLFAFCFAVTCGVFWEFIEYFCDVFLGTNLQKSVYVTDVSELAQYLNRFGRLMDPGMIDTMEDLMVDVIGAALSVLSCYIYAVKKNKEDAMPELRSELERAKERAKIKKGL